MDKLCYASPEDTAQIRALWDMAFPEEPDFNNWFFLNKYNPSLTLVLKEGAVIKAMLQLLPYTVRGVGRVSYIYGAATHPNFRRQGLMRRLIYRSFEIDKKKGAAASILIPQSKPLFDFYRRLGYETKFYVKSGEICKDVSADGYSLRDADFSDIPYMNSLYGKSCPLERSAEYWAEQIEMFNALGGRVCILIKGSAPRGYGFITDGLVQEAFGDCERLTALAGLKKYVTCGKGTPIGMAHCHSDKTELSDMYINLMFN